MSEATLPRNLPGYVPTETVKAYCDEITKRYNAYDALVTALQALSVRTCPDGTKCFCSDEPVDNHDAVCELARAALGKVA